jgi:hypothetical protein
MTLVAGPDLPRNAAQAFNCNICNVVDGMYFPNPGPPPAGVQIDNGTITDDNDGDADTLDPAVHGLANAFIEDFNTVSHSNGAGAPTIGDSTLIGSTSLRGTPVNRTIVVTAAPGTVLHYYCTFHPWMQAKITVAP